MKLKVQYLENYQPNWEPLHYAKAGDSGMDLRAAIENTIVLEAGQRLIVPTGIICQMEAQTDCYEIQIRPRSGLAAKNGIIVVNTPGTVDWGYRGEIKVILLNTGTERLEIHPGDRIAQMVICPIVRPQIQVVDAVDDSERGATGFGSSGRQ
ncbi:MAG: dUTP diphosphatase [Alphaproteobacteria bacterium]|nr:dUTP diphosphatase [Alphaproteobacteria bacterium]